MNCFRFTERSQTTVVADPYGDTLGLPPPSFRGDVVTISHDAVEFNNIDAVKGHTYVLRGPGEYEIGGVFIYAIPLHTYDEASGQMTYNVAHVVQYGPVKAVHLGTLNHIPEQSTIEQIGDVHAALVPVGGGQGLTANQAAEVIAMIEPNFIVPMQYHLPDLTIELDPVEKFLKAMGVSKVTEEDSLRLTTTSLPEQPQVVVLQPQIQS